MKGGSEEANKKGRKKGGGRRVDGRKKGSEEEGRKKGRERRMVARKQRRKEKAWKKGQAQTRRIRNTLSNCLCEPPYLQSTP